MAAIQRALATSVYPEGLDGSCAAQYVPESGELWVEYELPRQQVIPAVTGYRYVKARDDIQALPRKEAEIGKLYEQLVARVALRTLAEAFEVAPVTLVGGIVFNGYVSAKDRATGKPVRPLLISVHATRDAFGEIVLDEPELDPVACLRGYPERGDLPAPLRPGAGPPGRAVRPVEVQVRGGDERHRGTGQPPGPARAQAGGVRAPGPGAVRGDGHEVLGDPGIPG